MEWIGDSRECKQQVIWTGDLAQHPGAKTATQIFPDGNSEHFTNDPDEPHPTAECSIKIRGFIYEPHPTVIAAGLVDNLAAEYGLMKISHQVAYLTSRDCVKVPLTSLYEVNEVLPFSLRHVGTKLRAMNVGELEIKTRNIKSHEAEQFWQTETGRESKSRAVLNTIGSKTNRHCGGTNRARRIVLVRIAPIATIQLQQKMGWQRLLLTHSVLGMSQFLIINQLRS